MRAKWICALVVANLFMVTGESSCHDLPIAEELSKAKSAWDSLEKRAEQLEAWYAVTHHFKKSGKSDTTEFHAIVKGQNRRVHLRPTITDQPNKGYDQFGVLNNEKAFFVHRNPKASRHVLDSVVSPDEVKDRFFNYVDLYLFSPWKIRLVSLSKWVQNPEITVTKMEPEIRGHQNFVRMTLQRDPKAIKPRSTLSHISVLLDPDHDWRIVEHTSVYDFGKILVINFYNSKSGDTLLDLSRVHDTGFNKGGIKGNEVVVDFQKIAHRQISDDEFQMSAFGLPDIPLPEKSSSNRLLRLWISLIILAILCILAAILLRKAKRRKAAF